jgi:acyl-CoA hydrolase
MNFGEAPGYYRRFIERVDVACVKTCLMDEHGYFNFGGAIGYAKAMTERATKIVVETSTTMPYVFGREESIHISEVDHVIEGSNAPLTELGNPAPTEVDRKVAALIAPEARVPYRALPSGIW